MHTGVGAGELRDVSRGDEVVALCYPNSHTSMSPASGAV